MLLMAIFGGIFVVVYVGMLLLICSGFAEADRHAKTKDEWRRFVAEAKREGWYGFAEGCDHCDH